LNDLANERGGGELFFSDWTKKKRDKSGKKKKRIIGLP